VDSCLFVEDLIAALPEAFADPGDREEHLAEPLPYVALGQARIWIEEHTSADTMKRYWDFVEAQAVRAEGDTELETLLALECFEGVMWIDDVSEYLGPAARALRER
jgi:hypothetical protein